MPRSIRCWRLPLDDEYADGLKSNFADVANVAGRAGGAVNAAKFLQRFTGNVSLGPPGHRRHGLEGRRRQGLDRPAGRPAGALPAGPAGRGGAPPSAARKAASAAVGAAVTEVDFHFNAPDKLGYACRLLRKAVARMARAWWSSATRATLRDLDIALWTFSPLDFIAALPQRRRAGTSWRARRWCWPTAPRPRAAPAGAGQPGRRGARRLRALRAADRGRRQRRRRPRRPAARAGSTTRTGATPSAPTPTPGRPR